MPKGFHEDSIGPDEIGDTYEPSILSHEISYIGRPTMAYDRESTELRARRYLDRALGQRAGAAFEQARRPDRPGLVPDLEFVDELAVPGTSDVLVQFRQTRNGIPVTGSRCAVEMNQRGGLIIADVSIADVSGAPAVATLAPADAVARAFDHAGSGTPATDPDNRTKLTYYPIDDGDGVRWTLAYVVHDVPVADGTADPRSERYDFVIDATTGEEVKRIWSARALEALPSQCFGIDERGTRQEFDGSQAGDAFHMLDTFRHIATYDLGYGGVRPPLPVQNPTYDWGDSNRAAVMAHVNVTATMKFVKDVFERYGIDGKGMITESWVNVFPGKPNASEKPIFRNAFWDGRNQMLQFGQRRRADGSIESLSVLLDIVGHEIMHGVTSHTAKLEYFGETGALNESLSDIVGIAIANVAAGRERDVSDWDWVIGAGWGPDKPLRDMANPPASDVPQPDHMRDFLKTSADEGGVHTNSGIHNKAAQLVMTAADAAGASLFPPLLVVRFYYMALQRLNALATFADCGTRLAAVVARYYAGNIAVRDERVEAVRAAYDQVGIAIELKT